MSEVPAILAANQQYADGRGQVELPARPARGLAILTCMDARFQPFPALGLELGDAHVIRNAGGRASDDAIRSLVISVGVLGTREILVIHHTECGMMLNDNAGFRQQIAEAVGENPGPVDFLPIADLEGSVRDDVTTIRAHPAIPDDVAVSGFIFDVRTGRLHPVS